MAISVLFAYLFYAMALEPDAFAPAFDQFKLFIITWVVAIVSLYLIDEGALTRSGFLRLVVYLNCAFSTIKIAAVALHIAGIIKLLKFMELTGLRFMSLSITENVFRLQTSVDIVTPYIIFLVLQSDALGLKFSKKFKVFFIFISILSLILSFSRFLMAVAFMAFFFYWLSISIPKMVRALLAAILLLFGGVSVIGFDAAEKAFHLRFTSFGNYQSDETRREQIEALMKEHDEHQLLGKGLGGSAKNYFRDNSLTYSYEVQWVGFLMQFGAIGILLLFVPLFLITYAILTPPIDTVKVGLFCMFGIWILSGFTNPYMISLTSGIVYAFFTVAGDQLSRKCKTPLPSAPMPLKNT